MPTHQAHRELARADVYRLLSACYYQPESAFIEEDVFKQMASSMAIAAPQWVSAAATLEETFMSVGLDSLLLDYTRLFLGPFGILAKPYGSIYLDGDKQVMGDSTVRAMALYREGGLDVIESFQEAPDHVAVELEFLYLLSHQLGTAQVADDQGEIARLTDVKRSFLSGHLGRWIDPFTELVEKGAQTDFYRGLATLTRHFIHEDLKALALT